MYRDAYIETLLYRLLASYLIIVDGYRIEEIPLRYRTDTKMEMPDE